MKAEAKTISFLFNEDDRKLTKVEQVQIQVFVLVPESVAEVNDSVCA